MVEGFGKAILGDEWNVYSGGLETHDVNPKDIKTMKEVVSTFQIIPRI
ncbi:protein-tyrosine-phosphatase [Staphylococcus hominis]